jgi:hypothetical protein
MKWVEKHIVLTIVILVVVGYLYVNYGQSLLSSGSSSGSA